MGRSWRLFCPNTSKRYARQCPFTNEFNSKCKLIQIQLALTFTKSFDTACDDLRDKGIITGQGENSEVVCVQAPNDDGDNDYCQCLQAQLCVDVAKQPDEYEQAIYTYRSGEDILAPFSYNVSFFYLLFDSWNPLA